MKSYIHILCAALTAVLASCSNSDLPADSGANLRQVTVSVATDHAPATRATDPTITRYAISVWEDEVCSTPAEVFTDGTNHATNPTGSFAMILNCTKSYYCLFWADNGTGYTLDDALKSITLKDGSKASEAYCGKTTIPASTSSTSYTADLKRAVAKITLKETNEMPAGNTMTVTFDQYTVFDVQNGTAGTPAPCTITWTTTAKTGTTEAPVQLNDEDIFALAPIAGASLANVTFQCNDEGGVMVPNVPFRANYNTNIKGHYTTVSDQTFSVSVDDAWETEEPAS